MFISSAWSSSSHSIQLLPPTLLPYQYIFQIFSSNLSNLSSRGGINWSLCRSKSLGTSHSTQRPDDSSSSSTVLSLSLSLSVLQYTVLKCNTVPRDLSLYIGTR